MKKRVSSFLVSSFALVSCSAETSTASRAKDVVGPGGTVSRVEIQRQNVAIEYSLESLLRAAGYKKNQNKIELVTWRTNGDVQFELQFSKNDKAAHASIPYLKYFRNMRTGTEVWDREGLIPSMYDVIYVSFVSVTKSEEFYGQLTLTQLCTDRGSGVCSVIVNEGGSISEIKFK